MNREINVGHLDAALDLPVEHFRDVGRLFHDLLRHLRHRQRVEVGRSQRTLRLVPHHAVHVAHVEPDAVQVRLDETFRQAAPLPVAHVDLGRAAERRPSRLSAAGPGSGSLRPGGVSPRLSNRTNSHPCAVSVMRLSLWPGMAQVIDIAKMSGDTVKFGATVTIVDEETDEEQTVQIVGAYESNADEGKISITAPMARALIGKSEGESVTVRTPKGERDYEILSVEWKA